MDKKLFTPDEANAILPSIRHDLEALQSTKRTFEIKYIELHRKKKKSQTPVGAEDPFFELECELEFLQIEARSLVQSIFMKGAELKDIEQGLVDFPSAIDGEQVLLCWKQGEDGIHYYHGMHDGFTNRKPLHP